MNRFAAINAARQRTPSGTCVECGGQYPRKRTGGVWKHDCPGVLRQQRMQQITDGWGPGLAEQLQATMAQERRRAQRLHEEMSRASFSASFSAQGRQHETVTLSDGTLNMAALARAGDAVPGIAPPRIAVRCNRYMPPGQAVRVDGEVYLHPDDFDRLVRRVQAEQSVQLDAVLDQATYGDDPAWAGPVVTGRRCGDRPTGYGP